LVGKSGKKGRITGWTEMDYLTNIFNNRELASILWVITFSVILLFVKKVRASLNIVIKALVNRYVLISYAVVFLYIGLQLFLFYEIKYWDISLLKDTIFWIFGWAVLVIVNTNDAKRKIHFFSKVLLDIVKVTVILEFILNLFTFNFMVELVVLPFIILFVLLAALSDKKEKYVDVNRVANFIVVIYGFTILVFSAIKLVSDFQNVWTINNLRDFSLPIILSITFLPLLYVFALYLAYEHLFNRIVWITGNDKETASVTKKRIFTLCHLNLTKLNRFTREFAFKLDRTSTKQEIWKTINDLSLRK
jgi:hypothetical protein